MIRLLPLLAGATLLLSLLPQVSRGQAVIQPLGSEPAHAAPAAPAARRPAVLSLPFFDDFSRQPEGRPDEQRWQTTGGALINNRFPRRPPTKGVATLDGLNELGTSRGPISFIGAGDTLTSQPLDLSALTAADNVFLSFFWQAGSIIGPPEASGSRPIALYVDFMNRDELWQQVWQLNSPGDTSIFRFKSLPLNQAQYLHGKFRFRFRVNGSVYNNRDAWSVDYVRLDRNRTATDSTFRDIATSRALPSALKRYTAMPVAQFNQNATQELTDRTSTTANNFDVGPAPTPIRWTGTLEVLPGGPTSQFLSGGASIDANSRQLPVLGDIRSASVPITAAPKFLRQRVTLLTNETSPLTQPNDTITRITELGNYFAYDDGTAESSISLPPASTGPASYLALRFDLNQPDQIRAIRLYPVMATAAGRVITLNIWDDDGSGRPAATPKASKSYQIPATLPAGQTFVEVKFDAAVAVSNRFYAGYGQAATPQFVEFGFDLNNAPPPGYLLLNSLGTWSVNNTASTTRPAGALMLRPVTGSTITGTTAPAEVAATYLLYPNPTPDGRVRVQGRYTRATALDALGRVVWEQPAGQQGQAELTLPPLPAGLYFVRLTLPDGMLVTKRLSVLAR
ncbi:T9SS C-terminal target domain-containing protein [Hymenobacter sediminis]|uniref:T9SS type A sorting domain-containing protein n=1 Tax=Hymenobacter sediminis TaxID=2218621 RepID=UPI000DA692F2|nr:T9SS type A sorting domain-containing protein [Hymenobacter sediminis]RPD45002.1 T9SS C-terminal target domain-containing protein [Hymenobacter sediminis]